MEVLKKSLDEDQVAAASNLEHNGLVLAGPGSGKTRILTHRVGYLVRLDPSGTSRVLCLTFTVEAAKEMRRRVSELLSAAGRRRTHIANFHQFGLYLLRHYGHLCGVSRDSMILNEADRLDLVEDVVADLKRGSMDINVRSVVQFISNRKGRRQYRTDLLGDIPAPDLQRFFAEYEQRKDDRHLLDFDDLILKPTELLEQRADLRTLVQTTFPHLLVDELQDTSLLQLTLLNLLYNAARSRVFAVADDDQLVYEWRDARPETLVEFEERFDPTIFVLGRNYRCPPVIAAVADAVISQNVNRRAKVVVPVRTDIEGYVAVRAFEDLEEQANYVLGEVQRGVLAEGRSYAEHAVLARVGQSIAPIRQALEDAEIPMLEIGGHEVQNSSSVRLLVGSLRFAVVQDDLARRGLTKSRTRFNDRLGSEVFSEKVIDDATRGLSETFRPDFALALERELRLMEALDSYGEAQETVLLKRFLAMMELASVESDWADYAGMLRTICVDFGGLLHRVDAKFDGVRLMTIHTAKGTQFPVVFVVDVGDASFPNMSRRTRNTPEERRLLFVAITRAEAEVHVTWARESPWGRPGTGPSPFIADVEAGLRQAASSRLPA